MKLTPDLLEVCYDFLAETQPFVGWNLPPGDDVVFIVTRSRVEFGKYWRDGAIPHISISERSIGQVGTLVEKMSHEMIHLHLDMTGMESKGGDTNTHGMAFRRLASDVCKAHGYDPLAFF